MIVISLLLISLILSLTYAGKDLSPNDSVQQNPFMSQFCLELIEDPELIISIKSVAVVIVARNVINKVLLKTVCIFCNIGVLFTEIWYIR